ncbi:MAG: hypothetical protein PHW95_05655, partial [Patescibacteria group bacterium]|nr:hypothetical protein [Patescibacteria group bacterium]
MKELTSVKNPETVMGQPVWWHHHGTKMQVNERKTYFKKSVLAIEGSAARLSIFRASLVSTDHGDWFIGYELSHSSQCKTIGRVYLDNDHLSAAFGLNDLSGEFGDSLIERYGADSAEQGTYIRWQN